MVPCADDTALLHVICVSVSLSVVSVPLLPLKGNAHLVAHLVAHSCALDVCCERRSDVFR